MKRRVGTALYFLTVFLTLLIVQAPLQAYAGDLMWRTMHGEQDALILGEVTGLDGEMLTIRVEHVIMCENTTPKSRQIAPSDVPDLVNVTGIKEYRRSWNGKAAPQAGDLVMAAIDRDGRNWISTGVTLEISDLDASMTETATEENMDSEACAWQLFIRSDGKTVEFAFEGEDLSVDGEKVFSPSGSGQEAAGPVEQEEGKGMIRQDAKKQKNDAVLDDDKYIIGGAQGPTSIFIAGRFHWKRTLAVLTVVIAAAAGVCIWTAGKRKK